MRNFDFAVRPGGPLQGAVAVPGDKSVSHRALMLGAIAEGDTGISGFLAGEDTEATLHALVRMGVAVDRPAPTELVVHGVGLHGLAAPGGPVYLGNSGTSARLLAGLLAGQAFDATLTGDASLSRRPMGRVAEPLVRMGARISLSPDGTLPMRIRGNSPLTGIDYELPVASAQLKSALLLAGHYAQGRTCVREPAVTRDHTERMLAHFGAPVVRRGKRICVEPRKLTGTAVAVPGDLSSAAFFLVAASVVPGSDLRLSGVGINPTRAAVIGILRDMGAEIIQDNERTVSGERVADLRVRHRALHGIHIAPALVSIAIDEFPAILIAAAFAEGETGVNGAAELRVKESDRIDAMAAGLAALGVSAEPWADGIRVRGGRPRGGEVDSRGDHRIAMAFAVAGLAAGDMVTVRDCAAVNTSFPGFAEVLRGVGGDITEVVRR